MDLQELRLIGMLQGYSSSYLLYTTCEIGLFNTLYHGPRKLAEAAQELKIETDLLFRLVRPLISLKLISIERDRIGLTELGNRLAGEAEKSLEKMVLFCGREYMELWSKLHKALKQGTIPYLLREKSEFFETHANSAQKFNEFNDMMQENSFRLDLHNCSNHIKESDKEISFVDIGGGSGEILAKFLHRYPTAKGTIIDMAHVKKMAVNNIERLGLSSRCGFIEGDFFDEIPVTGEIYILSRILHDWDDERAGRILKNVSQVMNQNSKLLVIERVVPETINSQNLSYFMNDLHIWMICGGKERTLKEFSSLMIQAGLRIVSKEDLNDNTSLLEVQLKRHK